MEALLHYVWRHRIYPLEPLYTTKQQRIEVIDAGLPNRHAGPDFFNAKLKIDDVLWVGNVEIHTHASDWYAHGHDHDPLYANVILHVVEEADAEIFRSNGEPLPTLILHPPKEIAQRYEELQKAEFYPPCYEVIPSLSRLKIHSWLSALQVERFQQKVLKEKFKPNVTSDAIEKYYNEHKNYFVLNETLVRGIFVVVKDKVEGVKKFRNLISTLDGEHMADIENFVYHNSLKYEISLEKWITLASIKDYLPDNQIPNEASTLRNRKLVEVRNADLCYFILVTDCKMQGEEAPLEYVSDNITNILVNKQKIDFIKDLKSELYNDAVQQQLITYYDNK